MKKQLEKNFLITKAESAKAIGSGGLEVLSTPSMIAFMENTAFLLAKTLVSEDETTVGIEINVKHLMPTAIGKYIQIKTNLVEKNKKILLFQIEAYDKEALIGTAEHKRAIVNTERFLSSL